MRVFRDRRSASARAWPACSSLDQRSRCCRFRTSIRRSTSSPRISSRHRFPSADAVLSTRVRDDRRAPAAGRRLHLQQRRLDARHAPSHAAAAPARGRRVLRNDQGRRAARHRAALPASTPSMPLIRVAKLFGYSETSALSRSCYRWFSAFAAAAACSRGHALRRRANARERLRATWDVRT